MNTPEKITGRQLFLLLLPLVLATEVLSVPALVTINAKQDAWMSVLLSSWAGFWVILVLTALAKRYPGLTLGEYPSKILGKWLGKTVAVIITYMIFIHVSTVGKEFSTFVNTLLLPTTPSLVISGTFLVLCGVAVYAGIEVIARCGDFIVPFNIFGFTFVFFMTYGDMKFANLLPVFDAGVVNILKGSIVPAAFISEIFVIGFLIPFLNKPSEARKSSFSALFGIIIIMLTTVIQSLLVMDHLTARLTYPAFEVVRYVSIADFLERMDPVLASVWIYGVFLKECLFLFALCISVTHLFGLQHYRALVVPLTLLSIIGVQITYPNTAMGVHFLSQSFPLSAYTFEVLLPTLLLLFDTVKRRLIK